MGLSAFSPHFDMVNCAGMHSELSGFAKRKLKKDKDARRLATIQNVPGIESFL